MRDSINVIVTSTKKHSSDVFNNKRIKNSYKYVLPSNERLSDKQKNNVFIFFKEMINKGINKKGENETEIIKEILFLREEAERRKSIINEEENIITAVNDFIKITKEKGFEGKINMNFDSKCYC